MKLFILFFAFTITITFFSSCTNEGKNDKQNSVEVDSDKIKEAIINKAEIQLVKEEKPDYILDSLNIEYSTDAQKLVNKKLLLGWISIKDIYKLNDKTHITINYNRSRNDFNIDLVCTLEQANLIRSTQEEPYLKGKENKYIYLIVQPIYVKKVDLSFVSVEESEDTHIELEKHPHIGSNYFILKGELTKIVIKSYE